MGDKKKYKKELIAALEKLNRHEHEILETMTSMMFLKEMKENNITFEQGDTFSFDDHIFDYSPDKNIVRLAKLRRKMLKTMLKLSNSNKLKDKDLEFLA